MKRFGEKLRILRTYHELTLSGLATRLGYSTHSYISEIENGNKTPTANFILNVAILFECSTDELMRDEIEVNLETTYKPGGYNDAAIHRPKPDNKGARKI